MTRTITVLNAGLRNPSSSRLLADQMVSALRARVATLDDPASNSAGGLDVGVVDLRDHAHSITDAMLTGFATGELRDVLEAVAASDGLVVVTPTFQGSYSGLFKSFVDLIEPGSLRGLPAIVAATGGSERHSLMLDHSVRPVVAYLGAEPVPTGVFAATSDFGGAGSVALSERIDRAAAELVARMASRTPNAGGDPSLPQQAHQARQARDEFTDVVPFTELLNRYTR